MKKYKLFLVLFMSVFFSGCAVLDALIPKVETPKNPKEFRKIFSLKDKPDNIVTKKYTINKPYSYVVKKWKKRTATCLKRRIKTTTKYGYGLFSNTQVYNDDYSPKLKIYRKKSVLSIQFERTGDNYSTNAINPPSGAYFIVLDAYPLKGKKTRVVEYRWDLPFSNYNVITKAILNWGAGKSTACPDYQKIFG